MISHPIKNLNTDGNSKVVVLNRTSGKDELTVQVVISASAVVSVKGRLSSEAPFVELVSITTDTIQPLALVSELRFDVTGNNGVVDVFVRG